MFQTFQENSVIVSENRMRFLVTLASCSHKKIFSIPTVI